MLTPQVILAAAKPGANVTLSGSQGDVVLTGLKFTPAVTVLGLICRSLRVTNCQGLHFQASAVAFTPDHATVSFTAAVYINGCTDVTVNAARVTGGPAVNGVVETAAAVTSSGPGAGNVVGRPCGYGVNILNSVGCAFTDGEVAQFDRGIVLDRLTDCLIAGNDIHDRRRTGIAGANLTRVTIDRNTVRAASPWRWGDTPVGDHADCMAFWSDSGQTTPNAGLKVTNNLMEQLTGANLLGLWFQGGADGKSPFIDFEISGNTILLPNEQGIALWNSRNGVIARNVLITADVVGRDPKQRPTILLKTACDDIAVTGNRVSNPIFDNSGGHNPQSGNVLLTGQIAG